MSAIIVFLFCGWMTEEHVSIRMYENGNRISSTHRSRYGSSTAFCIKFPLIPKPNHMSLVCSAAVFLISPGGLISFCPMFLVIHFIFPLKSKINLWYLQSPWFPLALLSMVQCCLLNSAHLGPRILLFKFTTIRIAPLLIFPGISVQYLVAPMPTTSIIWTHMFQSSATQILSLGGHRFFFCRCVVMTSSCSFPSRTSKKPHLLGILE